MSPWITIMAFAFGLTGTILGIIHGVRQLFALRVRLRVRCYGLAIIQTKTQIDSCFCVEVINLSAFPITVTKIHFKPKNGSIGLFSMLDDGCLDGKRLPHRVESRDSIQICYKNLNGAATIIQQSKFVLVETASGETGKGSLREWKKRYPEGPATRQGEPSVEDAAVKDAPGHS